MNTNTKWYAPIFAFGLFFFIGELKSFPSTLFNVVFNYFMVLSTAIIIVYLAVKYNKWSRLFLICILPFLLWSAVGSINFFQCFSVAALLFALLATINILKE